MTELPAGDVSERIRQGYSRHVREKTGSYGTMQVIFTGKG